MKVLIVLALVAAATCAPAKEADREKRQLLGAYPLGYNGINSLGVASPLLSNQVQQQDTIESQHVQTSALKSTSTKSALIQPAFSGYQTAYPAYQPALQAYQPGYVSYQQPAYYTAPAAAQVLPVQSSYYNLPSSVQYVSQPSLYNNGLYNNAFYQPAYSGVVSPVSSVSSVVAPSVVNAGVVGTPVVSSVSGVVGTDPWC